MAKLKIRLIRSTISKKQDQIDTVKALGLKKLYSEVEKEDTPSIRGMLEKVKHLVEVQEV